MRWSEHEIVASLVWRFRAVSVDWRTSTWVYPYSSTIPRWSTNLPPIGARWGWLDGSATLTNTDKFTRMPRFHRRYDIETLKAAPFPDRNILDIN